MPPLYTPRNATLAERFAITDDEQCRLRTIVSKDEARRRHTERERNRRREAGAVDRASYEATAQHRRDMALVLRGEGMSYRKIAENMGTSLSQVQRMLARI